MSGHTYCTGTMTAGLHRLAFGMSLHRQVFHSSMARLQPWMASHAFHVRAGGAQGDTHSVAEDLLAKVHDKELVKTLGFINGEWVSANDGSTIEVHILVSVTLLGPQLKGCFFQMLFNSDDRQFDVQCV